MTPAMLPPVYRWLRESVALVALVDDRIYPAGRAPQDVQKPYITWQQVSGVPENYTDDDPDAKASRVQVNCWAAEHTGSVQLAVLADAALRPHGQKQLDLPDEPDPETGTFVFRQDWLFWLI